MKSTGDADSITTFPEQTLASTATVVYRMSNMVDDMASYKSNLSEFKK